MPPLLTTVSIVLVQAETCLPACERAEQNRGGECESITVLTLICFDPKPSQGTRAGRRDGGGPGGQGLEVGLWEWDEMG